MLKISSFSWETKKHYVKHLFFFPDKGAQFETMEYDTNVPAWHEAKNAAKRCGDLTKAIHKFGYTAYKNHKSAAY